MTISLQEMSMLSTLYAQPHRKYHNINHINDCLAELEAFSDPAFPSTQRDIVEAAIWYHDAIYNPYSKLNEFNSSALSENTQCLLVQDIIKFTARHTMDLTSLISKYRVEAQLPIKVMLDIDLSGFGKERMIFATNGMNIRHEYYNTPLRAFLEGRLKFYGELVKRPTLYYTEYFHNKYHEISQANIHWEMELIRKALCYVDITVWNRIMEEATKYYIQ